MSDPVLLVDTEDGVRTLTLHRPHRRNALDGELTTALAGAIREADADPQVRLTVLTGADPAFCAGADVKAVGAGDFDLDAALGADNDPWLALHESDTPTLAAVNGPAITGGLELVLRCDLVFASDRATFADTHARIGVHPGGGLTVLLPQAVGLRRAREMSFTGNAIDAATAHRWGLVNRVVAHDRLAAEVAAFARDLADDTALVRAINATYRMGAELPAADAFELERRRMRDHGIDAGQVEHRRAGLVERGRQQHRPRH